MAISLEAIILPDLIKENEVAWAGVLSETCRTLEGGLVVYEQEMSGKPVNLVGRSDTAWISRKTLLDIYALAQQPKATYVLSYEGASIDVRFRHEEGDVISAIPIIERPNPSDDDWYSDVVIKLMEV